MKKVSRVSIGAVVLLYVVSVSSLNCCEQEYSPAIDSLTYINAAVTTEPEPEVTTISIVEETQVDLEDEIFADSLEYLAMCVEAEAGNQSELGKRLVCDTILNRFDSGDYTNFYDVINEKGQYSVVSDGRILEVIPTEDTYRIVAEELESRTNTEVLYFRTEHYHTFGAPLFKEGSHYFSR